MKEVKMMEKLKHHHRIVSYIKHELISDGLFPGIAYCIGNHFQIFFTQWMYHHLYFLW